VTGDQWVFAQAYDLILELFPNPQEEQAFFLM
jgi:hypothetical protein